MENDQLSVTERNQLLAVLRELDHDAPRENRSETRRKIIVELQIRPIGKPRQEPQKAHLANVSANGLSLVTGRTMPIGNRFIVPLRFEDGGGWLVLCEVRNCRTCGEGHQVGARLLDHIDDPKGNSTPPMDWIL